MHSISHCLNTSSLTASQTHTVMLSLSSSSPVWLYFGIWSCSIMFSAQPSPWFSRELPPRSLVVLPSAVFRAKLPYHVNSWSPPIIVAEVAVSCLAQFFCWGWVPVCVELVVGGGDWSGSYKEKCESQQSTQLHWTSREKLRTQSWLHSYWWVKWNIIL